jgi:hypothetical protein
MFASEFRKILGEHFPLVSKHYKGSFQFSNYPHDLAERNFILWNSAENLPGEHWRIIYMSHKSVDIFDPLGVSQENLDQWNLKFDSEVMVAFNVHQIQPTSSASCGYFSLYFAIHRVLNPDLSMRQILAEDFSRSPDSNLDTIRSFFSQYDISVP